MHMTPFIILRSTSRVGILLTHVTTVTVIISANRNGIATLLRDSIITLANLLWTGTQRYRKVGQPSNNWRRAMEKEVTIVGKSYH